MDHLDALTKSMNYKPVVPGNQSNGSAGTKSYDNAGKASVETVPGKDLILLPLWTQDPLFSSSSKDSPDDGFKPSGGRKRRMLKIQGMNIVSLTVNAAGIKDNAVDENIVYGCVDNLNMPDLEEIGRFSNAKDDDSRADMNNLDMYFQVSPVSTTRIHKDHPIAQIIGDLNSAPQTRRMTKNLEEHGFLSTTLKQRRNHENLQNCLFACFLSQEEPKKVIHALKDPSWIEAMQEELLQFKLQEVWTLVELPNGKRAIRTQWVFRNKKDERGIVIKNKARLVAQGYTQEEGINYDEVFASVSIIEAIRLFLAYTSFKDFVVYQMDVKSAFLYGKIEEEFYVCQPPGFEDLDFPESVQRKEMCIEFEKMMHKKFQVSFMGELTFFVAHMCMENHKLFAQLKDADGEDVDEHLYRSMIGSLMYLTSSRSDIMFVLKGQPKLGLWYPKDSPFDLVAYSDIDYAGASLDRNSITGGCQFLGFRLISWQCKKQTVVANSITKDEYIAASNCCGQSTICIVKNPVFHPETKHIEIRHHFIRDSTEKKLIQMIKIHTDKNVAYLLTKAFDFSRFQYLIASIGMLNL
ncbi:putative ribonuclease H-like domain-containing protein [Tanacetum coccineum]